MTRPMMTPSGLPRLWLADCFPALPSQGAYWQGNEREDSSTSGVLARCLIYFKRVRPPAQPTASVRMPHKLWEWYGPGRVLATETRTDALGSERKPSSIVWIVTHGRLKRCAPEQLRHASDREKALAEGADAPTTTKLSMKSWMIGFFLRMKWLEDHHVNHDDHGTQAALHHQLQDV